MKIQNNLNLQTQKTTSFKGEANFVAAIEKKAQLNQEVEKLKNGLSTYKDEFQAVLSTAGNEAHGSVLCKETFDGILQACVDAIKPKLKEQGIEVTFSKFKPE